MALGLGLTLSRKGRAAVVKPARQEPVVDLVIVLAVLAVAGAAIAGPPHPRTRAWTSIWAAGPEAADPDPDEALLKIDGQTVRERVRVSVGGSEIRVRLSNEFGSTPLAVGSATVALPIGPAAVRTESIRSLTFGGRRSVTIPAGAPVLSDPVTLAVAPGSEISISLYFPGRVATPTLHALALKRAIVTPRGDFTRASSVEAQASSASSVLVTEVLAPRAPGERLVVAFGDSLTDGDGSTTDADNSWPSQLARRIHQGKRGATLAVVNEGIAGNRLLGEGPFRALGTSALARFDRDVLARPGVTHVVLLEGINDLGFPGARLGGLGLADPEDTRGAEDLIGAYRQLIARAHAGGLKVIGATLTPFEGVDIPGYYSASKEAERQATNAWIRAGGAFDGVIDFDAVLRDPNHPSRMRADYVSRDRLHPTDVGYRAMADAIDLSLFQ